MKPKSTTLSERFGFQDGELITPKHDEIMLWLDANAERLFPSDRDVPWTEKEILWAAQNYPSQDVPGKSSVTKRKWEVPIVAANGFMIGFIDMEIVVQKSTLWENGKGKLMAGSEAWQVHLVEVKPEIRSLGEVIRQVRMYQCHRNSQTKFHVCCPDDRFTEQLAAQGIGFIKPDL